ncbi:hypothetical protein HJG60_012176 [Phyllostomus discolor]|uniref:Uncharacterized protein n=1 Tax=Phyllostomus discolor TaxID=89673 RepID=A0A834DUP6_9CHIR|nr:hypothetical protein HJG60_012176 [Phyllostomus discolor]
MESDSEEETPTSSTGVKRKRDSQPTDKGREKALKLTEKVTATLRQIQEKHKGGKKPKIIIFCSRRGKKVSENQPKTDEEEQEEQEDSAPPSEDSASASEESLTASEDSRMASEQSPSETEESLSESEDSPYTPNEPETQDP